MAHSCRLRRLAYVWSLIWIVAGLDTPLFAQRCRADAGYERMVTGGWVSPDGRIHYTIQVDPNVPEGVRKAVDGARQDWNALTAKTNVVLDIASTPSSRGELIIRRSDNQEDHHACGAFDSATSIVYYSIRDYEDWVASMQHPQAAVIPMSHEIGHFLGLDDEHPVINSIMAQGYPPCLGYALYPSVRRPTADDARVVGECIRKHRAVLTSNQPQ